MATQSGQAWMRDPEGLWEPKGGALLCWGVQGGLPGGGGMFSFAVKINTIKSIVSIYCYKHVKSLSCIDFMPYYLNIVNFT